jgi:hypothetical protein
MRAVRGVEEEEEEEEVVVVLVVVVVDRGARGPTPLVSSARHN